MAAGLVLLGAGHLFYGYLAPLFGAPASPNEGLLAGLVVRTLSCVLFVVGLAPATPPRFSRSTALGLALAAFFAWSMLAQESGDLPTLVHTGRIEAMTAAGSAPVPGLAVRSFAEVLAGDDLRPEERARMLARLHEQADGLGVLVEDVRASAAAERDGFAIAPRQAPVAELLSGAASYAEALIGGHRLSVVDKTEGMRVLADPERVGQVLRNLISNAVKYSPVGSEVTLKAEPVADAERVRVSVSDRGSGIHPDDLERVFEKFGRGRDPDGRRVGGVGLGLYLSRQISRSHGSDLTVSSVPGEGSVFAFELEASEVGRGERR